MCKDKEHGGRRCSADNSEARRRRRKAKQSLDTNSAIIVLEGKRVQPYEKPLSMNEVREEAKSISALLSEPVHPDAKVQAEKDTVLEQQITRLGLAIGLEADRRSGFNEEEYLKGLEAFPPASPELHKRLLEIEDVEIESVNDEIWDLEHKFHVRREDVAEHEAKLDELRNKYESLIDEIEEIKNTIQQFDGARKNFQDGHLEKVTEAYRSIIAEIRPVGGTIAVHDRSDPKVVTDFNNTVGRYYPSEWLKRSKDAGSVVLGVAGNRPAYSTTFFSLAEEENAETHVIPKIQAINVDDVDDYIEKMHSDEDPVKKVGEVYQVGDTKFQAVRMSIRTEYDPYADMPGKDGIQGRPEGEGWKHGYVPLKRKPTEVPPEKRWHRVSTVQGEELKQLTTFDEENPLRNTSIYHEFSHRVEDTSPNQQVIIRMEHSFLRRRCGDAEGNMPSLIPIYESPSNPYKHSMEVGYPNDFMDKYIGKYYAGVSGTQATEVLSMGSEAAFGKNYGAFIGIGDNWKKDLDHRAFTLGIFATA